MKQKQREREKDGAGEGVEEPAEDAGWDKHVPCGVQGRWVISCQLDVGHEAQSKGWNQGWKIMAKGLGLGAQFHR